MPEPAPKKTPKSPDLDFRDATFSPASFNEEARTVEVTWTTGARVERYSFQIGRFIEELEVSKAAVDLGRLNAGAPVLNAHSGSFDARSIMANVVPGSAKIVGKEGVATVRFDSAENDPDAEKVFRKIGSGIVSGSSVGYRVLAMQKTTEAVDGVPVYRVTKWEPMEISVAPIPADIGSKFRSFSMPSENSEIALIENNTPSVLAERERIHGITISARAAKFSDQEIDALIASGASLEAARSQIVEEMIKRDAALGKPGSGPPAGVSFVSDFSTRRSQVVADVRALKIGALELARIALSDAGQRLPSNSRQLVERAMSTSDFAAILDDSVGSSLRAGFENEPASHREWVRVEEADLIDTDLKRPILGAAPSLARVEESAEYTHGSLDEDATSYRVQKYGKIVSLSWETLVNDRLGAFLRMIPAIGQAARRAEADLVYDLFAENSGEGPTMNDAEPLFHSSHSNVTAALASLDAASLAAGRVLLRKQTGVGGGLLALRPVALVVPAELEHQSELLLAAASRITNTSVEANVPQWVSGLKLVVEPRLDEESAFLVADPSQIDSFVLGLLQENIEGPYTETKIDFNTDTHHWKVRHVFGAKALDFRGIVKIDLSGGE